MAVVPTVTGLKQVLSNIKRANAQIASGTERGIKVAGLTLLKESQKRVPVEFGVLKASGYARPRGKGFNTKVDVGFTASYALFVHEAVGMKLKGEKRTPSPPHKGRYWDPQGRATAKFLEGPARTMGPELRKIIRNYGRVR